MEELVHAGVKEIYLIDFEHESSLHFAIILNCFEREEMKFTKETPDQDEISKDDAILRVYSIIKPGEPITIENAEKDLHSMFFSSRRYDLGRVGRYKLNKKFDYTEQVKTHTLIKEDIINTMKWLIRVYIGEIERRRHRPPGQPPRALGRGASHQPAEDAPSPAWSASPRSACP